MIYLISVADDCSSVCHSSGGDRKPSGLLKLIPRMFNAQYLSLGTNYSGTCDKGHLILRGHLS